jgi:hypothetical protein
VANIGDRYVIEIDSKMTNKNGTLYGVKGFKNLVFDEEGLSRLTKVETPFWKLGDIVKDRINGRIGVVYALKESGFNAIWDDGFSMYKKNDDMVVWQGNVWDLWRRYEGMRNGRKRNDRQSCAKTKQKLYRH